MNKSDSIKIKSIITETVDEYRAPYDRVTQKYPRRFVFSMSTNDLEPFKDQTGNRRYWIIKIDEKVNFAWLSDNRDQLFAEAYYCLMNQIELPQVPLDIAQKIQEEATSKDAWYDAIMEYVQTNIRYRKGDPEFTITLEDIYKHALKGDSLSKMDLGVQMRIGNILRNDLKMEKRRIMEDGVRQHRYYLIPHEAERLAESFKPREDDDKF